MQDFRTEIKALQKTLSQKDQEFFPVLVEVVKIAEALVETGGRSPAHMAYNKAVESYEKLIEAKLWLAQALEAIGEVGEDMYVPDMPDEESSVS